MLAIAGAGVWSLVIAYSAGNIAMDIILWRLIPWRPRLRPQRKHLRSLLSFGGATTAVGIMAAFLAEFDNLVVGRVLGVTQLGYYSIATNCRFCSSSASPRCPATCCSPRSRRSSCTR